VPRQPMKLTMILALYMICLIVIGIWHLYLSVHNLALAFKHIIWAFGLGFSVGFPVAALGALFKYPLGGIIAGALVWYLLALGYIILWVGIPVEWIY